MHVSMKQVRATARVQCQQPRAKTNWIWSKCFMPFPSWFIVSHFPPAPILWATLLCLCIIDGAAGHVNDHVLTKSCVKWFRMGFVTFTMTHDPYYVIITSRHVICWFSFTIYHPTVRTSTSSKCGTLYKSSENYVKTPVHALRSKVPACQYNQVLDSLATKDLSINK